MLNKYQAGIFPTFNKVSFNVCYDSETEEESCQINGFLKKILSWNKSTIDESEAPPVGNRLQMSEPENRLINEMNHACTDVCIWKVCFQLWAGGRKAKGCTGGWEHHGVIILKLWQNKNKAIIMETGAATRLTCSDPENIRCVAQRERKKEF